MSFTYRCPCRSFRGSEFQKVTELRDIGLAVFRHVQRNINEDPRRFTNAENDTYIFYNCKDIDITSAAFVPEFNKNKTSCPRCFYIVEHTQQLLHNVPIIEKNDIVGICDHCRTKTRPFACQRCEESVKRFVINLRLNIWLRKVPSVQNIENDNNVHDTEQILRSKISRSHTDVNNKMPLTRNTQPTLTKSYSCENMQRLLKKQYTERLSKTYDSEESLIDSLASIDKITKKFDDHKKFGYLFPANISKEPAGKSEGDKNLGQPVTEFKSNRIPNIEENISNTAVASKEKNHGQVESPKPNDLKKQNITKEGIQKYGRQKENSSKENQDENKIIKGKIKENIFLTKSKRNEKIQEIEQDKEKIKAVKDNDTLLKNKSLIEKHLQPKLKIERGAISKDHRTEENNLKLTNSSDNNKNKNRLNPNTKLVEKSADEDNSAKNKIDKPLNHALAGKSKKDVRKTIQQNDVNTSLKEDRTRNKNKQKLNTGNCPADAKHVKIKPTIDKSEKALRKQDVSKVENKEQKRIEKEGPKFDNKNGDNNQTNKIFEKKMEQSSPRKSRKQKEVVTVEIDNEKLATQFKNKNGVESKKVVSPKITVTPKKETVQFHKTGTSTSIKNKIDGEKETHRSDTKGKPMSLTLKEEHFKNDSFGLQVKAKSKFKKDLQPEMLSSGRKNGGRIQATKSLTNVSQETLFRKNKFSNSDENDIKRLREFFDQGQRSINKETVVPPFVEKLPIVFKHLNHKTIVPNCIICADLDVSLNLEELMNKKCIVPEEYKYIKGERVFKAKEPRKVFKEDDLELNTQEKKPTLFKSIYTIHNGDETESEHTGDSRNTSLNVDGPTKVNGVIKYALSDRQFIEKGWTVLPVEKVVSKEFTFGMRPAHPEFDWFKYNKNKRYMQYDTGEKLADFDDKGRGRWFYKNGRIALDYYDSEELNGKQRIVIYSSGELDRRGRFYPITVLATFDYAGNGIVFDHSGKIRLKYNQKTGVVLDREIGPVSRWKWHSLTEPLELKRVMIDTHLNDPEIMKLGGTQGVENDKEKRRKTEDTDMLAVEFDNYMKEKNKLLDHELRPYQIKTKAFKINEQFSLRIMDQANIHIIFRDHLKQLKLNIGMILDNEDIKDIDTFDVGQVLNTVEQYPAKSGSIEEMQSVLANARRCELANAERKRLLVPTVDRVNVPVRSESLSGLTSSFGPPPQTETSLFSSNTYNKSKKSFTKNKYYNTRVI